MLTKKLQELKKELESKITRSEDDNKTLLILNLIDGDPRYNSVFIEKRGDTFSKSFATNAFKCPVCGK